MLKLNPIRSAVKNKRVVLVEDSIVRGTTIRKIVQILRQADAREVHVRVGCPPIRFPCYLGIDMKTRTQFIANEKTVPEIADFINADSVGYLSLRGLIAALKHSRDDVCLGCLTGEYPVPIPGEKLRRAKPLEMFEESMNKAGLPRRKTKTAA
jgi:amidophosphoribosyltransferase